MKANKKITHPINVLKKFIQEENRKNGRLDEQAYKTYKAIISELKDDETIIVPLYALRYILTLSFNCLIVEDLLEIQARQSMDYDKLEMFKDNDGDIHIMSCCYSFCISEVDANRIIIKSAESKKAS